VRSWLTAEGTGIVSTDLNQRIAAAKAKVRIPDAWRALGLPHPPQDGQQSARSPFRADRNPSVSIFNGGKGFKDHAHPDHRGDVVSFVQIATGCTRREAVEAVLTWAGDLAPINPGRLRTAVIPAAKAPLVLPDRPRDEEPKPPPSLTDARPLSPRECQSIADSRGLPATACAFLAGTGQLIALRDRDGTPWAWCLCDGPGWPEPGDDAPRFPAVAYAAEARRLDRQPFPNGKKAKALSGSKKDWPVGLSALAWPGREWRVVLAVEGGPDLLASHTLIAHLDRRDVLPVAILSRGTRRIHPAAADLLEGRHIHALPHNDPPKNGQDFRNGRTAAEAWATDLFWPAGAARVTFTTLESLTRPDGQPAKDLCEAIEHGGLGRNASKLSHLIP